MHIYVNIIKSVQPISFLNPVTVEFSLLTVSVTGPRQLYILNLHYIMTKLSRDTTLLQSDPSYSV